MTITAGPSPHMLMRCFWTVAVEIDRIEGLHRVQGQSVQPPGFRFVGEVVHVAGNQQQRRRGIFRDRGGQFAAESLQFRQIGAADGDADDADVRARRANSGNCTSIACSSRCGLGVERESRDAPGQSLRQFQVGLDRPPGISHRSHGATAHAAPPGSMVGTEDDDSRGDDDSREHGGGKASRINPAGVRDHGRRPGRGGSSLPAAKNSSSVRAISSRPPG